MNQYAENKIFPPGLTLEWQRPWTQWCRIQVWLKKSWLSYVFGFKLHIGIFNVCRIFCIHWIKIEYWYLDIKNANEIPTRLISATLMAAIKKNSKAAGIIISGGQRCISFQIHNLHICLLLWRLSQVNEGHIWILRAIWKSWCSVAFRIN